MRMTPPSTLKKGNSARWEWRLPQLSRKVIVQDENDASLISHEKVIAQDENDASLNSQER